MSGLFVTFEGGDGSGKSTQAALLAEWLDDAGPHGRAHPRAGRHRRRAWRCARSCCTAAGDIAPRAEALLYAADRAHHIATVVRPALERGDVVIQDRYLDSSVAYQGAGRVLDAAEEVRELSLWADRRAAPRPDRSCSTSTRRSARGASTNARTRYDRLEAEEARFPRPGARRLPRAGRRRTGALPRARRRPIARVRRQRAQRAAAIVGCRQMSRLRLGSCTCGVG